jgi:hypothetical protein
LHDTVRVDGQYGPGPVKVSLSFAAWKAGDAAAATYEIPVPEPESR